MTILILISTWTSALVQATENSDAELVRKHESLAEIEHTVTRMRDELVRRRADRRALIAELEARERNVAELALANREFDRLLKEQQRITSALRARQDVAEQALEREVALLGDLLRSAYVMGRADRLRLLLNQDDLAQAARAMSYFDYFNRARLTRVYDTKRSANRLRGLLRTAEDETQRLSRLADSQKETRRKLEVARNQRAGILHQLDATIASRSDSLEQLSTDARIMRRLILHLRQRAQIKAEFDIRQDTFEALRGKLAWPIIEPRVLAHFGAPKAHTGLHWDGLLLATENGEEVRVVDGGRVVYADWLRGYGLTIVVDHKGGFMTLYGHNEALLSERDEWVGGGQPIAISGSSGGRAQPVLYFAIRHNGRPLDPGKWLRQTGYSEG